MTLEVFPQGGNGNSRNTGNAFAYQLISDLTAVSAPTNNRLAYVAETDAYYTFVSGDATTPNGWTIVTHANGRWFLVGFKISIAPRGGVLDDDVRINSAIAACAGLTTIFLRRGTFRIAAPLYMYAMTKLFGSGIGATILQSTIAAGPALANVILSQSGVNLAGAGTVNATPVLYSRTITSNVNVAVGDWIEVQRAAPNLYVRMYEVIAKAGAGPVYTYTVDRAINVPFQAGDVVYPVDDLKHDITVGHMTIQGTGTRALNFLQCVRVLAHDILITGTGSNRFTEGGSFDIGNFDSEFLRIRVENTIGNGLGMETDERIRFSKCSVDNCGGSYGFFCFDSYESELTECTATRCTLGFWIGNDNPLTTGFGGMTVTGGHAYGNVYGLQVGRGHRATIQGFTAVGNDSAGVMVAGADATTGAAYDVAIVGCTIRDNNRVTQTSVYGGLVLQNVIGVSTVGNLLDGNYSAGVNVLDGVKLWSGDVGTVRNTILADSRRAAILINAAASGTTGRIVGPVLDTANFGIEFDAANLGLAFDNAKITNMATARYAAAFYGVIDGVLYKPDGATTVDVSNGVRTIVCADTAACTVTNPMVNAQDGQAVDYVATNGNTTVNRANAYLNGGALWTSTSTQPGTATLGLIYRSALSAAAERYRVNTNT